MKRRDVQLVGDILDAIDAIARHRMSGGLESELVVDAVRMRLIEIGEAAKGVSSQLKSRTPEIAWRQVAGMRDRLAHRYFEKEIDIIRGTVENDLSVLAEALKSAMREEIG